MPARSLIDLRNAKKRDHLFSDRRHAAVDADLESGVICLIQQLQHRLIDLDGAFLEFRGHFGIGFGRHKRCDFGIARHHRLRAPNASSTHPPLVRRQIATDRHCCWSADKHRPRWQSIIRLRCRSASRQLHKEIHTFGRLGWVRMPIEFLHGHPSAQRTLKGFASRSRPSTTSKPSITKYVALSLGAGRIYWRSFRRKRSDTRVGGRISGPGSEPLNRGLRTQSRHLPTSDRSLAGFPPTDKDACDAEAQGGRRCIMLSGLLAVLIVGTLAGSVEADRGDGCHRTPCYPTYDRGYYGGWGGYNSYGGGGGGSHGQPGHR